MAEPCPTPASVPLAATTRPKNLLLSTPDPFGSNGRLTSPPPFQRPRHLAELFSEHGGHGGNMRLMEMLRQAVTSELSHLGVEHDFVRSKGKTRKSPRPKDNHNGPSAISATNNGLKV